MTAPNAPSNPQSAKTKKRRALIAELLVDLHVYGGLGVVLYAGALSAYLPLALAFVGIALVSIGLYQRALVITLNWRVARRQRIAKQRDSI